VSYDQTPTPPGAAPPPVYDPAPAAAPAPKSGTSGWMVAFAVVLVLALGGLAAAIISKGDSGKTTATTPTVTVKTTTVQNTTTVTTPATPANVTVAPNVTLNSSGAPQPVQTSTAAKATTGTTSTP
jgi:flagellar basal body-associated protein FliL